jgi:hypothetical protein
MAFWEARDTAKEEARIAVATSMRSEIDKVGEAHSRQLENAKAALDSLANR